MLKLLLVAILIVALSESCRVIEERANGMTAERDSYPGFVLIEAFNGYTMKNMCSGILISSQYVLTSASCAFGTTILNVHVYAYKLRDEFEDNRGIYRIDSQTDLHLDGYDGLNRVNDIALIKMPDSFSTAGKDYLKFANLPSADMSVGNSGETVGWGLLDYNDDHAAALKQTLSLNVTTQQECEQAYESLNWSNGAEGRACIKSPASNCVSDVGSPFLIGDTVYGLQTRNQIESCDDAEKPNLITSVFDHIDWINSIII